MRTEELDWQGQEKGRWLSSLCLPKLTVLNLSLLYLVLLVWDIWDLIGSCSWKWWVELLYKRIGVVKPPSQWAEEMGRTRSCECGIEFRKAFVGNRTSNEWRWASIISLSETEAWFLSNGPGWGFHSLGTCLWEALNPRYPIERYLKQDGGFAKPIPFELTASENKWKLSFASHLSF